MIMLGLNEAINYLAMANRVRWYDHVLRRELNTEAEVSMKKGRPRKTYEGKLRKKV